MCPEEVTVFEAFGQQAQPVAVSPQQLDEVAAAAAKGEHVARGRIGRELPLRQSV